MSRPVIRVARRLLLPPALFAFVIAAGATLEDPPTASATWDVEAYDRCVADNTNPGDSLDAILAAEQLCCWGSSGVWNANAHKCQAPAVEGGGTDTPTPPRAGLPTVPVQPPNVGSPPATTPSVPVKPPMAG